MTSIVVKSDALADPSSLSDEKKSPALFQADRQFVDERHFRDLSAGMADSADDEVDIDGDHPCRQPP